MEKHKAVLAKYLPEESLDLIFCWIKDYKVHLRISRQRSTKLGDYRPAYNGQPHRISVNHDLNKYAFLTTFVHELAHLVVFENYRQRAKPHGSEWKQTFRELMNPVFDLQFFPEDLEEALHQYLRNAGASSTSNTHLAKTLKKYDEHQSLGIYIEELPENSIFILENGKQFKKLEKRRKRYKCLNLNNGKYYLFDPLAMVMPLEGEEGN